MPSLSDAIKYTRCDNRTKDWREREKTPTFFDKAHKYKQRAVETMRTVLMLYSTRIQLKYIYARRL